MDKKMELQIRMIALKDVEIWLNEQYLEIQEELNKIRGEE